MNPFQFLVVVWLVHPHLTLLTLAGKLGAYAWLVSRTPIGKGLDDKRSAAPVDHGQMFRAVKQRSASLGQ